MPERPRALRRNVASPLSHINTRLREKSEDCYHAPCARPSTLRLCMDPQGHGLKIKDVLNSARRSCGSPRCAQSPSSGFDVRPWLRMPRLKPREQSESKARAKREPQRARRARSASRVAGRPSWPRRRCAPPHAQARSVPRGRFGPIWFNVRRQSTWLFQRIFRLDHCVMGSVWMPVRGIRFGCSRGWS